MKFKLTVIIIKIFHFQIEIWRTNRCLFCCWNPFWTFKNSSLKKKQLCNQKKKLLLDKTTLKLTILLFFLNWNRNHYSKKKKNSFRRMPSLTITFWFTNTDWRNKILPFCPLDGFQKEKNSFFSKSFLPSVFLLLLHFFVFALQICFSE